MGHGVWLLQSFPHSSKVQLYNKYNRMHLEKREEKTRKKQNAHEFSIELHILSMNNFELHIPSPHLCVISIQFFFCILSFLFLVINGFSKNFSKHSKILGKYQLGKWTKVIIVEKVKVTYTSISPVKKKKAHFDWRSKIVLGSISILKWYYIHFIPFIYLSSMPLRCDRVDDVPFTWRKISFGPRTANVIH